MIFELHILQNFAPSNLNRDDTNAPKDCFFGGVRRARISSQCIKRSVRRHDAFARRVREGGGDIGVRTKRIKNRLMELFAQNYQKTDQAAVEIVSEGIIDLLGLKLKDPEKTEYLLYFGENEILDLAQIAMDFWDLILSQKQAEQEDADGKGKKKKKGKTDNKALKPAVDALKNVIAKPRKDVKSYAADIALFGRMVADGKNMNVDAACQVAHALSTHKVDMEMDYYTAVDDLLPDDTAGSDMIGTVEFNSSCFYRYANIDCGQLQKNLGEGNSDLFIAAVKGFTEAAIKTVPTGKQNSMAAQNPPEYVRAVIRKDNFPWSLANAFQKPVRADQQTSIQEASIQALESYFSKLSAAYGAEDVICDTVMDLVSEKGSFKELIQDITATLAQHPGETR